AGSDPGRAFVRVARRPLRHLPLNLLESARRFFIEEPGQCFGDQCGQVSPLLHVRELEAGGSQDHHLRNRDRHAIRGDFGRWLRSRHEGDRSDPRKFSQVFSCAYRMIVSHAITPMAQPTETYRTSITIAGEVASAALTACEPENENRNFSNLCEVSLRAYLEPRGYLAP